MTTRVVTLLVTNVSSLISRKSFTRFENAVYVTLPQKSKNCNIENRMVQTQFVILVDIFDEWCTFRLFYVKINILDGVDFAG